jgi:hypothetical protein
LLSTNFGAVAEAAVPVAAGAFWIQPLIVTF